MLVRMLDLAGKDVSGMIADIHSRKPTGEYHSAGVVKHPDWRKLKAVEIRTEKGERWLRWTWETAGKLREGRDGGYDCGFSGLMLGYGDHDDVCIEVRQ